jgi:two-component system, NtrC family, sensor histidine kinase HydH
MANRRHWQGAALGLCRDGRGCSQPGADPARRAGQFAVVFRPDYVGRVDLRTRTSLFCGVVALAIAISILLQGRLRRQQLLTAALAADMGLWYLVQWLYQWNRSDVWARSTAVLAVLLPLFVLHLFDSIVPRLKRSSTLLRLTGFLTIPLFILALSPLGNRGWSRTVIFIYVFSTIAGGLGALALRGERSGSRETQRRVRFLVSIGALAVAFILADFLWFIGASLPPIGAVLTVVFVFVLAQSLTRQRLIDLYDLLGHLVLNATLAFSLAGIFYVFVVLLGGFETMYLGAILAAIVILLLFEPLRQKMESTIHTFFFRERAELEREVANARLGLTHVLEVGTMVSVVLAAIEQSRRATAGAIYLRDPNGSDYPLSGSFGPGAPTCIEAAAARPVLDRVAELGCVIIERIVLEALDHRRDGRVHVAEADERLLAAAENLGPLKNGVCVGIRGDDRSLVGLLVVVDDRVRDAFSSDEIVLFESLALQMGVVLENSRQYRRMRDRDRLAALGQMAAGIAHEIKNPLGAIKGAAQLLGEDHAGATIDPTSQEFVGIILEEVERLDRVVGSVLDYARPSQGNPFIIDVNAAVRRMAQLLMSERKEGLNIEVQLAEPLTPIRADPEQLRQVLINLVRNAIQAMNGRGTVTITTWQRRDWRPGWSGPSAGSDWVEIAVRDEGPGIMPQVLENLFVPFFSTKIKGTGLGLAISQRLVESMGGRILVASQPNQGSTFSVVMPASTDVVTPLPGKTSELKPS